MGGASNMGGASIMGRGVVSHVNFSLDFKSFMENERTVRTRDTRPLSIDDLKSNQHLSCRYIYFRL